MKDTIRNCISIYESDKLIYDIVLESGYNSLYQAMESLHIQKSKLCIVSDTNVSSYYLNEVVRLLQREGNTVETFTFLAGESSKTLETTTQLYEKLIQAKFDRNDILIALGGGVVGDLTGFVAATYLRGIRFVQIPTSLLAMVDSSIGGKTGVDFKAYKNMVGSFHQPSLVYMNLNAMQTLPARQYFSGFAEVIKYGLIADKEFYAWLKMNKEALIKKDADAVEYMVYRSCKNKQATVEKDPTEKGIRAYLNFGHTLGHAIEKAMEFCLLHGECVALGMVCAGYLSYRKGSITQPELSELIQLLEDFNLPTTLKECNVESIIEYTKNDKKMEGGQIKFVLLKTIGEAYLDQTLEDEDMRDAVNYLITRRGRAL